MASVGGTGPGAARDFTAFKKETEASISAKRTAHANTDNDLTRTNGDLEARAVFLGNFARMHSILGKFRKNAQYFREFP